MADEHPTAHELREEPAGELVKRLSEETSHLVRLELNLARAEMSAKVTTMRAGAGLLGGAALMALLTAGALTACLIALLATAMETWVAALIVTVIYAVAAGVTAAAGRSRVARAAPPVPEQTIETVKEDVEWAKTRGISGTR